MIDRSPRPSAAKHAGGAPRTPFALLVFGLVVGGMVALLALNTASAANEVTRHDLAEKDQSVAAQVEQLQIDAQNSAAPGNLAAAAAALGMVPAGNPGFIEIGRNGGVRVMGKAAPASVVVVPVAPTPTPTPTTTSSTAKSATSTASATATTSTSATATTSTSSTTSATATPARTAGHRARHARAAGHRPGDSPSPSTAAAPTPTPTPTPTTTLPGGTR